MSKKHTEFAETMRNIMRGNMEIKRENLSKSIEGFEEETRFLQEILEAEFNDLFGPIEGDKEN